MSAVTATSHVALGKRSADETEYVNYYDESTIKDLVTREGISPDSLYDATEKRPVFEIAREKHLWSVVLLLLEHGAECVDQESLLREALDAEAWEVVEHLLRKGKKSSAVVCNAILEKAWKEGVWEVVQCFLDKDLDISYLEQCGVSKLHLNAAKGNPTLGGALFVTPMKVETLYAKDWQGRSSLHIASIFGHVDWIEPLLQPVPIIEPIISGGSAAGLVYLDRSQSMDEPDTRGSTPLKCFLEGGVRIKKRVGAEHSLFATFKAKAARIVPQFLDSGADPNSEDRRKRTPFQEACLLGVVNIVSQFRGRGVTFDEDKTFFIDAALSNDLDTVKELLKQNAPIDAVNTLGNSALIYAARGSCSDEIFQVILGEGPNLDVVNNRRETALIVALQNGFFDKAGALIEAGAGVNLGRGKNNRTALHIACCGEDVDLVTQLLIAGADPTARDKNQLTPLHLACKKGEGAIVRVLLRGGADPEAFDRMKRTPRGLVPSEKLLEIIDIFEKESSVRREPSLSSFSSSSRLPGKSEWESTPLHEACKTGNISLVEEELSKEGINIDAKDGDEKTALHVASAKGFHLVVGKLLAAGANPQEVDDTGRTPLHYACRCASVEAIQQILAALPLDEEKKAGINTPDEWKKTPLKLFLERGTKIASGKIEGDLEAYRKAAETILPLLFAAGADLTIVDSAKRLPLHEAAFIGDESIVKQLIIHGSPLTSDDCIQTPLHEALVRGVEEVIYLLVSAGAPLEEVNSSGETPLVLASKEICPYEAFQVLMQCRPNVNPKGETSPLYHAINSLSPEKVRDLIAAGAIVSDDPPLLDLAFVKGSAINSSSPPYSETRQKGAKIMKMLLDAGATFDDVKRGIRALFFAIEEEDTKLLEKLITAKVDVNAAKIENSQLTYPLHAACAKGNPDLVGLLLRKCANPLAKDFAGKVPHKLVLPEKVGAITEVYDAVDREMKQKGVIG
ncbi:MAG: Phosphocholine transferase AnkX [Chlamydiae bacterium]|nr:Phosphocholine transferase AnkX [Chlamydiota bacterium]